MLARAICYLVGHDWRRVYWHEQHITWSRSDLEECDRCEERR